MELFDKKFVHFMWKDELEGKQGFFNNNIDNLITFVNNCNKRFYGTCSQSESSYYPFHYNEEGNNTQFFYYDPHYDCKKAYYEGRKIQWHHSDGRWIDDSEPVWDAREYRIKPDVAYVIIERTPPASLCYTESPQLYPHVYFIGTKEQCSEYIQSHKKFVEVMKAWEDGKIIQFYSVDHVWLDSNEPKWIDTTEYRIKPGTVHVILDSHGDWATTSEYSEEKHGHSFKTFDDLDAAIDWTNRHSEWSEIAKAWEESKKIQFHDQRVLDYPDWFDCDEPKWIDGCEYRIKPELMTYRHLAEWLAKGNGEFKFLDELRNTYWSYTPDIENDELKKDYKIRRWGSDEWIEPTEQIYLEDCVAYSPCGPKENGK